MYPLYNVPFIDLFQSLKALKIRIKKCFKWKKTATGVNPGIFNKDSPISKDALQLDIMKAVSESYIQKAELTLPDYIKEPVLTRSGACDRILSKYGL